MKIILDAFGGDNGAIEAVRGAAMAVEKENVEILLVGNEAELNGIFEKENISKKSITILDAADVVEMEDDPTTVIRAKKESSMVKALTALKQGMGDALVSSGNTGALLTGATAIVGRIRGVRRGALAPIIPSRFGGALLIDCGANVECTAEYLYQFALMGSAYMECSHGRKAPRVALLNNGTEEKKGTEVYREAYKLLKNAAEQGEINFIGNIEARDMFSGKADVLICDGFTGNMILKTIEGTAKFFSTELKGMFMASPISKIAGLIVKPKINELKSMMDYKEVGGSPIMGIRKPVFKAHGSSDARAFYSAICRAIKFAEGGAIESIEKKLGSIKQDEKGE